MTVATHFTSKADTSPRFLVLNTDTNACARVDRTTEGDHGGDVIHLGNIVPEKWEPRTLRSTQIRLTYLHSSPAFIHLATLPLLLSP